VCYAAEVGPPPAVRTTASTSSAIELKQRAGHYLVSIYPHMSGVSKLAVCIAMVCCQHAVQGLDGPIHTPAGVAKPAAQSFFCLLMLRRTSKNLTVPGVPMLCTHLQQGLVHLLTAIVILLSCKQLLWHNSSIRCKARRPGRCMHHVRRCSCCCLHSCCCYSQHVGLQTADQLLWCVLRQL